MFDGSTTRSRTRYIEEGWRPLPPARSAERKAFVTRKRSSRCMRYPDLGRMMIERSVCRILGFCAPMKEIEDENKYRDAQIQINAPWRS